MNKIIPETFHCYFEARRPLSVRRDVDDFISKDRHLLIVPKTCRIPILVLARDITLRAFKGYFMSLPQSHHSNCYFLREIAQMYMYMSPYTYMYMYIYMCMYMYMYTICFRNNQEVSVF